MSYLTTEKKANIFVKNKNNESLLHAVIFKKYTRCLKFLLNKIILAKRLQTMQRLAYNFPSKWNKTPV